jgi:hypothetical protein
MKAKYLLLVFILFTLFCCKKVAPVNPHSFVAVKLKDIHITSLPSPYYHFDYRDDKHISSFNFANGLIYDVAYTGDDLTLMKNNTSGTSKDSVKYNYTNGKLTSIHVITDAGIFYRRAFLTYYPSGQLQTLEWEIITANQSFTQDQTLTFTYYPNDNVKEIVHHYFAVGPQPNITFTDKYENYDDRINVDGFTLVHTSQTKFPPILMPGITLQVNNAGRIVRTGNAAYTYEVNYTYTYDGTGRPLVKTGDFVLTNGPDIGQHFEVKTTYSYYN